MSVFSQLKRWLIGNPIATKHAHHEKLPVLFGLPIFASDALSSVAYASEEIMHIFKHAGEGAFFNYTVWIAMAICALIWIVAISYIQTIYAYPNGGGSYIVSKTNLGVRWGMVAGASLLIDYILTVAVSISAGVAAVVSMVPSIQPHAVQVCVLAIALLTVANLRGAKESGALFAIPTYTFVVCIASLFVIGAFFTKAPTEIPAAWTQEKPGLTHLGMIFLVLKAFAAGCTALTGIEAVSDGVQAFKAPSQRNAAKTMMLMALILSSLFLGMSYLVTKFHAVPMDYTDPGFKTTAAQITANIFGDKTAGFFTIQIATAAILFLAANTAYADFPRVCSFLARDGFLPRQFAALGDRLVFQNGIVGLALLSMLLVVIFKGDVSLLIPLYAVGVFLCFTLSQFGMVVHSRQNKRPAWSTMLSAVGGTITLIVLIIIFVTKFLVGAWIALLAGSALIYVFTRIRKHYTYLANALNVEPGDSVPEVKGTVLLLVPRVHKGILQAIAYAQAMAKDVRGVHVTLDKASAERIKADWNKFGQDMPLVILESRYRSLVEPITDYIDQALQESPNQMVTVIVPQAVPKYWWQGLLHNNAAVSLKLALGSRKNVVITNVRYFLK